MAESAGAIVISIAGFKAIFTPHYQGCVEQLAQLAQLAHVFNVEQVEQHDEQAGKVRRCDSIQAAPAMGPMRKNIVIDNEAPTHALKWVYSRPELIGTGLPVSHGYGRDGLVRKAGRMALSMFLTSRPPDARKNADGGFLSHNGAETMTPTTPKMGTLSLGTTPATTSVSLARRLAIETALIAALFHVRTGHTQHCIELATGRATRAASMLKQACEAGTTTDAKGV